MSQDIALELNVNVNDSQLDRLHQKAATILSRVRQLSTRTSAALEANERETLRAIGRQEAAETRALQSLLGRYRDYSVSRLTVLQNRTQNELDLLRRGYDRGLIDYAAFEDNRTKILSRYEKQRLSLTEHYQTLSNRQLMDNLERLRRDNERFGREWQMTWREIHSRIDKDQIDSFAAWRLGWRETLDHFKSTGRHMMDAGRETASALTDTFADVVKLGLKGQFNDIGDAFEKLGGKILDIWVNALARIVAETAMVQASGLLGLNFNMSGGMSSPYGAVGKGLDLAKLFQARNQAAQGRAGMNVFKMLGEKVAKWFGLSSDSSAGLQNWETWLTQSKEGTAAYNYLIGEGYTPEQVSSPWSYIGQEYAAGINQITTVGEAGIMESGAWASLADTGASAYSSAAAYEGMTAASADWAASDGGYGFGTYAGAALNAFQALSALAEGEEYSLGTAAHYGGLAALRFVPYVGDLLATAGGFLDSRQMGKWIEENPGMVFGVGSLLDPLGGFLLDAFLGDGSWASDVVDWFGDLFDWHSGGPIQWPRLHAGSFIGKGLRSDEVPVIAQQGEYMLQRSAVNRLGAGFLDDLNEGRASLGDTYNVTVVVEGDFIGDEENTERLARAVEQKLLEISERRFG